jgi:hypothetical protein
MCSGRIGLAMELYLMYDLESSLRTLPLFPLWYIKVGLEAPTTRTPIHGYGLYCNATGSWNILEQLRIPVWSAVDTCADTCVLSYRSMGCSL